MLKVSCSQGKEKLLFHVYLFLQTEPQNIVVFSKLVVVARYNAMPLMKGRNQCRRVSPIGFKCWQVFFISAAYHSQGRPFWQRGEDACFLADIKLGNTGQQKLP